MRLFHSKTIRTTIIASAAWLVCMPPVSVASEQSFNTLPSLILGPYPTYLTLKHDPQSRSPRVKLNTTLKDNNTAPMWEPSTEGGMQLSLNNPPSLPVFVTLTVPEQWEGTLRAIGSGHQIKGENLKLKQLNIHLTGQETIELSGKVSTLTLRITGYLQMRSPQLQVNTLHFDGIGAGNLDVAISEYLWGEAVGAFAISYSGKPSKGVSMKQRGSSTLKSLTDSTTQ